MKCTYVLCAEEEIGFNVGIDGEVLIYLNFIPTHFRVPFDTRTFYMVALSEE